MQSNTANTANPNTSVITPSVPSKVSANTSVKVTDDTGVKATDDTSVVTTSANLKTTSNPCVNASGDDVTDLILSNMSRLSQKRFETCLFLSSGIVLFDDEHSANLAQSSANKVLDAYSKSNISVTEIEYQVK